MCGITGLFDTRSKRPVATRAAPHEQQRSTTAAPTKAACTSSPAWASGHRRLSIIDIATGQQPLFNEDGSVVIVFNGEIYNYQELIPELQALGHVFHTKSDTECIVHAWESWGEDCVQRFRGMFAFALWDRKKQTCSWRATGWASSRCTTRCSTTARCCSAPS
jgi:asparagine synthase (glutamine-hydrolysing)